MLVLVLSILAAAPVAAAPLAGPCASGAVYDPACDVNHDGVVNVLDVQLTAGHWNQTGTFTSDNSHNHLGQMWTGTNNPLTITGAYGAPLYAPLNLSNSTGVGLRITSANGGSGIYIDSTSDNGMWVSSAANDGVRVDSAGNSGVYVVSAGGDGMRVSSAANHGVYVNSVVNSGVVVGLAGATGVWANTTNASGQWGFYTPDRIFGTIGMFSALSLVAQVTGPDKLTPGDIVAVDGITDPLPGSTVHTPLVRLADGTFSNIVGVVESHLALIQQPSRPQPAESETDIEAPPLELRSVDGPAQAGDYVAITVMGAAQVKVQDGETILAGQRLTAGDGGSVRALQTRSLDGMAVTEGAPVIGVALEPSKDGLVWVLVNPQ